MKSFLQNNYWEEEITPDIIKAGRISKGDWIFWSIMFVSALYLIIRTVQSLWSR